MAFVPVGARLLSLRAGMPMYGGTMAGAPFHPPSLPGITTSAVQAALLKEVGRQLAGTGGGDPLRVGQVVQARVTANADGTPALLLGGVKIAAQLPDDVAPDQLLRLRVQQSGPERVVLQIIKDPGAAQATGPATAAATAALGATDGADATGPAAGATQAAPTPAQQAAANAVPWAVIAMPGGAQARLWLDPEQNGDEQEQTCSRERLRTMVVRYDSPVLGRTDVVLRLDPAQLDATVLAPAGAALDAVRSAVPELRLALAGAVDRPVAIVTGGNPHEAFNVHA
ncbi:MAG: flagellar hook-length control protein FliK [Patulibacter sp.]